MNAKSQLSTRPTPAPPAPARQTPPAFVPPPEPEWFSLEGAELIAKPYMVASDDRGTNAIAAVRKATRHLVNWRWERGFKWVAFLNRMDLPFTPTHYMDLPGGWMMRS